MVRGMDTRKQVELLRLRIEAIRKQFNEAVELLDSVAKASADDAREIAKLRGVADDLQDEIEGLRIGGSHSTEKGVCCE